LTANPETDGQQAVFLSYASEDMAPAARICEGLRATGIEVWFDRSELRGGDAWDAAIRRHIKQCALFIPVISGNAHSRAEGYFRLEWKLAIDRSHLMASDRAFLVPVVVDDTPESDDRIPDRFREVHWTRLPGGETSPAFVERIVRLLAGPGVSGGARPTPAAPLPPAPPTSPAPAPAKSWWARPIGLCLLAAAVIGAAVVGFSVRSHWRPSAPLPYSLADRRMTFAVLPFQAPAGDAHGAQAAAATTEAFASLLDGETLFVHTVTRASVDKALPHATELRDIARALDVHFLIRGSLAKTKDGYGVDVVVVDGNSERALQSRSLAIPGDALPPRWRDDIDDALQAMMNEAVKVEVRAAADKPDDELDVRDLTLRAWAAWSAHHGADAKDAYLQSTKLLRRALDASPDDRLATFLMADFNLCDCVMGWSTNVEEQKAIGAAELERYLAMDPSNTTMLVDKASLFQLRGRYEESLIIVDSLLQQDPENFDASWVKAQTLLHLGRAAEALPIADALLARMPNRFQSLKDLDAAAHYAVGDYASASRLAQSAAAQMSEAALRSPLTGPVRLTLAAAEAHLGHLDRAHLALSDFAASVPNVTTIAAIRKWMYPTANLAGSELLFDGLKLAGVKDQ
jgi:tetratricopeptide (TPR) repeat protein